MSGRCTKVLVLLDFGLCIDMARFPPGTVFKVEKKRSFPCIEMLTGRPWTYQAGLAITTLPSQHLLVSYRFLQNEGSGPHSFWRKRLIGRFRTRPWWIWILSLWQLMSLTLNLGRWMSRNVLDMNNRFKNEIPAQALIYWHGLELVTLITDFLEAGSSDLVFKCTIIPKRKQMAEIFFVDSLDSILHWVHGSHLDISVVVTPERRIGRHWIHQLHFDFSRICLTTSKIRLPI